jgi:multiple sugar transport system ATP-binding protein
MASVGIRSVRKSFGATQVLHGVDIEIGDEEFVVLVGPSGCGKSTLLRMIAGLEEVSCGEIVIGGAVVNELPPKDRDIAMVFQNYALYPHMTVRDNMAFSLKLRKAPRGEIDTRVKRAADILGLAPYLDRYPRQLSGGQRQRVAMGRAIVRDPQVFLFDEPLSNLDAKLRVQMRTEIKALHQRLRTTSVYVTHDQVEAMTLADRIVVLHDGRVEQIGSPLELYDHPANLFVAGFIGSPAMNFIPGTLRRDGDRAAVQAKDGALLPLDGRAPGQDGQEVIYGVRPEHLSVTTADGVPARVKLVEPTGADTFVYADLAGTPICAVFSERHAFRPGDQIQLLPQLPVVHLFDAATGQVLR